MCAERGTEDRLRAALEGRYVIDREIGRGGMATVYLARDLKHDRAVAIKLLRDEVPSRNAPDRFLREIQVTAGLVHPHILPLLDSDTVGGLHYYVMPFVKGESLRERLAREGRLPVEEAVAITSEIADALSHAHSHGLIHRDIKPGNILLEEGHVFLADFGIVRPSDSSVSDLTREGSVVGTPHYQSPEQWTGEAKLDGRSDLYSLGCVLFEMLTGAPPFRGGSPEVVAGKHLHERPPPARLVSPSVPEEVDRVISRVLAKEPGERFPTAEDFSLALQDALKRSSFQEAEKKSDLRAPWYGRMGGAVGMLGVALLLWAGAQVFPWVGGGWRAVSDTTRFLVVAGAGGGGPGSDLDVAQRVSSALERWAEITVADHSLSEGPAADGEEGSASDEEILSIAEGLDVGRIIRVSEGVAGSDHRVTAELLDVGTAGARLGSASVLIPRTLEGVDSLLTGLVDRLLFRDAGNGGGLPVPGTGLLASQHAFLEGISRLEEGDLVGADSAFSLAVNRDPRHAKAHLMVALTRFWRGLEPPQWRSAAQRASLGEDLSSRDRTLLGAVQAQAQGDYPTACRLWEALTREEPGYFGGWLGRAICLEDDHAVVRDEASPSGWSFRTSYHEALREYTRAFQLFPQVLRSFRRGSFSELRLLFMTAANSRRPGQHRGAGDPVEFVAVPAWQADSLALVPYPRDAPGIQLTVEPEALETAVHRQRAQLHEVILGWVSAFPDDPDANEALAVALALLGDPQALDVVQDARSLARTGGEELRLAGVEAWVQLAFALPQDEGGVSRATTLADSVLSAPGSEEILDPLFLAALASLTGRAYRAAELLRSPGAGEELMAPPPLRETAPGLLIYAALGGPADSLDVLEERVSTGIEEALPAEERRLARWMWLARPATLAFFHHRMDALQTMEGEGDWLLDLQAAFSAGDSAALSAGFRALDQAREGLLSSSITLDALLSEAELLVLMGQTLQAAERLDPALRALPQAVPLILNDPVWAASVVRASALRASIALQLDDTDTAREWQRAVKNLWANADPFLQHRINEIDSHFE